MKIRKQKYQARTLPHMAIPSDEGNMLSSYRRTRTALQGPISLPPLVMHPGLVSDEYSMLPSQFAWVSSMRRKTHNAGEHDEHAPARSSSPRHDNAGRIKAARGRPQSPRRLHSVVAPDRLSRSPSQPPTPALALAPPPTAPIPNTTLSSHVRFQESLRVRLPRCALRQHRVCGALPLRRQACDPPHPRDPPGLQA